MQFIRQSPMLLNTACQISMPRLGVRALAARTIEISRDHLKVRLPREIGEQWLERMDLGEQAVIEIPLPPSRLVSARTICCHGLAAPVLSAQYLRLDVQVARISIRDARHPGLRPRLALRKGAGQ